MAGRVELRYGDMFDGPSDLLVLPCSSAMTLAHAVEEKMRALSIPSPRGPLRVGDVEVQPFERGDNIAAYVGFAASVKGPGSEESVIRNIGVELGKITRGRRGIKRISCPLLGSRAGGLKPRQSFTELKSGFLSAADETGLLRISVLERNVYEDLIRLPSRESGMRGDSEPRENHRVLISYTGTDSSHKE